MTESPANNVRVSSYAPSAFSRQSNSVYISPTSLDLNTPLDEFIPISRSAVNRLFGLERQKPSIIKRNKSISPLAKDDTATTNESSLLPKKSVSFSSNKVVILFNREG